jgi:hypothetical protein
MAPRDHLKRPRCAKCGGILGPDEAEHGEGTRCAERAGATRLTKVLLTLDVPRLDALRGEGEGRSELVRRLVDAEHERDGRA